MYYKGNNQGPKIDTNNSSYFFVQHVSLMLTFPLEHFCNQSFLPGGQNGLILN
jgi:hypothetical protein